jgi:uncharacterized protein
MTTPEQSATHPARDANDETHFVELVFRNSKNALIVPRLADLELPDAYLVSGCLFQTVWNCLSGKAPTADILDYDVFYYHASDLSWDAEDAVIQRCARAFADLDVDVQVRNQARVHLWYAEKFRTECPPLRSSRDGIDHFLNQSSCFGVRRVGESTEVYAPFGFSDVFDMIVRPNRRRPLPDIYRQKAARWATCWPNLTVVPW